MKRKEKAWQSSKYPTEEWRGGGHFHAMIHIQQFPGPCDSLSPLLGIDASASEVMVKKSTISVKASIDV